MISLWQSDSSNFEKSAIASRIRLIIAPTNIVVRVVNDFCLLIWLAKNVVNVSHFGTRNVWWMTKSSGNNRSNQRASILLQHSFDGCSFIIDGNAHWSVMTIKKHSMKHSNEQTTPKTSCSLTTYLSQLLLKNPASPNPEPDESHLIQSPRFVLQCETFFAFAAWFLLCWKCASKLSFHSN